MRKTTILIALLMCACVSAFGQSGLPQWKVVKEFHVTGGSTPIAPKVLFTPKKRGLYRMTGYLAGYGPFQELSMATNINWTDPSAGVMQNGAYVLFNSDIHLGVVTAYPFTPVAGTPVTAEVDIYGQPNGITYDTVFTIEELTH